ncbi:GNAT family N-acetyltransferase [Luteipulveratus flavus]|uniref:GNAT family N-acetyltransferase n=1 Tax=Luteipulveratus flavus TaxID=3031728 RepID=A0ABT6C892_9MICO|nr:GNAT family N-acetyltransferase [Luteipulveratus sp. YIM 133296]MDF8265154.1 GNAT family N-acetyltransferase [Luteipulveratus sp. YIM 133296]
MSSNALAIRCHVLESADLTTDLTDAAALLLQRLVADGAALGWTAPPGRAEVADLLWELVDDSPQDASLVVAMVGDDLAGFGFWRRYIRPTYRPHADLEKLAVAKEFQRRGIARALVTELARTAREAGVEMLTLDFRGDNEGAERLYVSCGFREYGRLEEFVAPDAEHRYDRVLHVLDLREAD